LTVTTPVFTVCVLEAVERSRPRAVAAPHTSAITPARARRSVHRSLALVAVSEVTPSGEHRFLRAV